MTKSSTKRSLLFSTLSLVLCFAMLLGTTFAWFTDNVSTVNNVIVSGNLDVELEYSTDMATWNKVKADTNIFKDALWEPGYTEVVYLRVTNAGNLAMKYKLGVNVASETPGKTRDGDVEFKLSDFIEYGVVENVTAAYEADTDAGRKAAKAAVATPVKLNTAFEKEYNLVGKTATATDSDTYALVVYMPESVTNEANHNGTNVPKINLGLSVFATQLAAESDSFNNQYDVDSEYAANVSTIDELANALAAGDNIILTDDIVFTAENKLGNSYGFLTYASIDGGGKTITDNSAARYAAFYAGNIDYVKNLTVQTNSGYGVYVVASDREMNFSNVTFEKSSLGSVIYSESTKNLILDNVVATGTGTSDGSFGHAVVFATGPISSSNITINSGTYTATDANGYAVASFYGSVVTINGGTFTGNLTTDGLGKIVIKGGTFNVDPSAYVADGYIATMSNGVWTVTAE